MTRTLLLGVLALALLAGTGTPAPAADTAKEVVERAVKTAGRDKEGANVHHTWIDKGKLTVLGMTIEYTGKWWFSGPDKSRFEIKASVGGMDVEFTSVVNGDKSWESASGQVQEVTGDKLEYVKGQAYASWVYALTPLLTDKGFTLKPVAGLKVDGADTNGVEVTRKDRPTITLYFDQKTGLLAMAAGTVKNEFDEWKEVKEEVYFSDWKDGEGKRKVFTKLKVVRGGETLIESVEADHKVHDKLDDKLFAPLTK